MGSFPFSDNRGFTALEILVVLVIMGILSAFALTRLATYDVSLVTTTEAIKAHIRYTQGRAMNTSVNWGLYSADGTTYWLFNNGDPNNNRKNLPGEDTQIVNLAADGIAFSGGGFTLTFDSLGRPCNDAAAQTPRTADLTLTLTQSGEPNQTITITRNTGFVP